MRRDDGTTKGDGSRRAAGHRYAVVGLGVFGRNLARGLARRGQPVLAIDNDPRAIQAIADEVDMAVCVDATDENALAEIDLDRVTCAIVAIGNEATEASILATALLRQSGVPRVIGRAVSELHERILQAVGAHETINPEEDASRRLAQRLIYPNTLEQIQLGDQVEIAELEAPASFFGRSLVELDLRREHHISVLALRRGDATFPATGGDLRVEAGDHLVILAAPAAVERIAALT